jgi:hypothetical protein
MKELVAACLDFVSQQHGIRSVPEKQVNGPRSNPWYDPVLFGRAEKAA